ncbi:hypothetical protein [Hoeflea prorocentri]|uniref:Tat pathway signal protein n=1 Tax=Hoeflea prorocentri TaxID=1922333 RepID=A0A9X3ZGE0_9HYPH|nr:hypothetical protein [Hoeflea prorocentri]MCY6379681.1 hypothetical protein [Hoeflea prorocentri]MDA5397481.1 hypothetical protein [Hoeflea prorocentri]
MKTLFATTIAVFSILSQVASADDKAPVLSLELNKLAKSESGCLATFMVKNGFEAPLEKVAFEIVLFNGDGLVDRMMVLDFSPLSTGKTRVRQFDLAGADCNSISRVLINDAAACKGASVAATACLESLETNARPDVEFGS